MQNSWFYFFRKTHNGILHCVLECVPSCHKKNQKAARALPQIPQRCSRSSSWLERASSIPRPNRLDSRQWTSLLNIIHKSSGYQLYMLNILICKWMTLVKFKYRRLVNFVHNNNFSFIIYWIIQSVNYLFTTLNLGGYIPQHRVAIFLVASWIVHELYCASVWPTIWRLCLLNNPFSLATVHADAIRMPPVTAAGAITTTATLTISWTSWSTPGLERKYNSSNINRFPHSGGHSRLKLC